MKIKIVLLSLVISTSSFADTILGFYAGANYWNYDMSGSINSSNNQLNHVDIGFTNDNSNIFYAALEHPIPFLPNIKLQHNTIRTEGVININNANNVDGFLGQSFNVNSDLDFSHTDLILYYEILDNWLNLDLGFSFKNFDGYTYFYAGAILDDRSEFDDWIPMLYAKGKFDLPFTGFSASATVEALSFESNKVTDIAVAIGYESGNGLGAEAGYRNLTVDLNTLRNFDSDITMDGFYLGLNFHF